MSNKAEQISFFDDCQKQRTRRNSLHLRERLLTEKGFEAFDDSEILTTILSFARGAVESTELVERLFDSFGSLKSILEARPEQLLAVDGMTVSRASIISIILPLIRVWHRSE